MVSTAQSLYYSQRRASDAKKILDKLFVENSDEQSHELRMHPFHPTLFQAHVDSMNVCDALGETQASIAHCQQVLKAACALLPPCYLETSNYYYYLGMLYEEAMKSKQQVSASSGGQSGTRKEGKGRGGSGGGGGDERQKEIDNDNEERTLALEAFTTCFEMRKVLFGEGHPYTAKVKDKMVKWRRNR